MVGLVLVGHSVDVVRGLLAMVRQAAPGVPIEGAGGLSGGRLGTSGVNVAAALQLARRLGPGHTIATILCDNGSKYQSRLFNKKWLAEKGLLEAAGVAQQVSSALQPIPITETPRVVQRLSA